VTMDQLLALMKSRSGTRIFIGNMDQVSTWLRHKGIFMRQPGTYLVKISGNEVPISDIKPPRGKLRNPSAVAVYAQRLRAGEQAPPITLWKLKTGLFKFYIEDGDHRYLAAKMAGHKFIAARVMPGFIEFFQRGDAVCHRIVPADDAGPSAPARTPRRPTKSPRRSGTSVVPASTV
jgi:hypothetical protein